MYPAANHGLRGPSPGVRLSSQSAATLLQLATVPREHTTASGLEGADLDLLKDVLLGSIHQSTYRIVPLVPGAPRRIHRVATDRVREALDKRGFELQRAMAGLSSGEPMVSGGRLDHLQSCIEQVLDHGKQRVRRSGPGSGEVQPDGVSAWNDPAVPDGDHDGIACLIEIERRKVK
jgi:hypothetical protein